MKAKNGHLHAVALLLTSSGAFDTVRVTAVINVAIDTGGAARGSEISVEGSQRSYGGDGITRLHPTAIIRLCITCRERVESGQWGRF